MEAVFFIGIQASGKSTFYKQRFFDTHVRINLDQLRTRHREQKLLAFCLETGQRFVIDKMNLTAASRQHAIEAARLAGFRVIGYAFQSRLADCLRRNATRHGRQRIPDRGLIATVAQLEPPQRAEGFDELYYVRIGENGEWLVEPWQDEALS